MTMVKCFVVVMEGRLSGVGQFRVLFVRTRL